MVTFLFLYGFLTYWNQSDYVLWVFFRNVISSSGSGYGVVEDGQVNVGVAEEMGHPHPPPTIDAALGSYLESRTSKGISNRLRCSPGVHLYYFSNRQNNSILDRRWTFLCCLKKKKSISLT